MNFCNVDVKKMAQHFVSVVKCIWCVLVINGGVLGTHSDLKLRIQFRNCMNKRLFMRCLRIDHCDTVFNLRFSVFVRCVCGAMFLP